MANNLTCLGNILNFSVVDPMEGRFELVHLRETPVWMNVGLLILFTLVVVNHLYMSYLDREGQKFRLILNAANDK
jgi:hypothetical protein